MKFHKNMNWLLSKLAHSATRPDVNPPFVNSRNFIQLKESFQEGEDILHGGNCAQLSDEAISRAFEWPLGETMWYFAFGSNLNPAVFEKRRNIHPLQVFPGVVQGYELVFDLPALPFVEPVMGNIRPNDQTSLHGAAFRVTKSQMDQILATEGGGMAYKYISVDIALYKGEATRTTMVQGFTLMSSSRIVASPHLPAECLPSNRYLSLIQEGANHRGLSAAWIQKLAAQPRLKPLSFWQKGMVLVLGLVLLFPVVLPLACLVHVKRIALGRREQSLRACFFTP